MRCGRPASRSCRWPTTRASSAGSTAFRTPATKAVRTTRRAAPTGRTGTRVRAGPGPTPMRAAARSNPRRGDRRMVVPQRRRLLPPRGTARARRPARRAARPRRPRTPGAPPATHAPDPTVTTTRSGGATTTTAPSGGAAAPPAGSGGDGGGGSATATGGTASAVGSGSAGSIGATGPSGAGRGRRPRGRHRCHRLDRHLGGPDDRRSGRPEGRRDQLDPPAGSGAGSAAGAWLGRAPSRRSALEPR